MQTTTIEIDFDIHKLIEAERRSFAEQPFQALRRLLGLPEKLEAETGSEPEPESGRPWIEDGLVIPHGTVARMEYLRGSQKYEGKFLDGYLVVGGARYSSLSEAAGALAKTKDGRRPSLNGWNYWEVKTPGSDQWELMDHKRKRAQGKSIF